VQLAAGEGGQGGHPADSQQQSTSSARRGKRKGAYTEEERRYRRRLANRCVPSLIPARFRHGAQRHGHVFDLKIVGGVWRAECYPPRCVLDHVCAQGTCESLPLQQLLRCGSCLGSPSTAAYAAYHHAVLVVMSLSPTALPATSPGLSFFIFSATLFHQTQRTCAGQLHLCNVLGSAVDSHNKS
jgi:hypothetical protein